MIPDWAWAAAAGVIATAAGLWCKRILESVDRANEKLAEMLAKFEAHDAILKALHGRIDRVEEFIDRRKR